MTVASSIFLSVRWLCKVWIGILSRLPLCLPGWLLVLPLALRPAHWICDSCRIFLLPTARLCASCDLGNMSFWLLRGQVVTAHVAPSWIIASNDTGGCFVSAMIAKASKRNTESEKLLSC